MNLHTEAARTDLQIELETLSVEMGIARYREVLAREGNGAVSAGDQLLKAAMQPMIAEVTEWLAVTGEGLASRNAGVYYFINQLAPESLAWITAHCAINMLHERPPLLRVAQQVAQNIEAAINMEVITAANPKLGAKVAQQMAKIGPSRNKLVFIRKGMDMVDVKAIQWDDKTRVRVGTLLLSLFEKSTGLVVNQTVHLSGSRTQILLRPTESCLKWLEASHARCELLSPYRLPMVCTPREWTTPRNGGYLSASMRQPLVKTRNQGYLQTLRDHQMPWVYHSVNTLQNTTWAINEDVYAVLKALWEESSTAAKLPSRDPLPLPAKSWAEGETPEPEVLQKWKCEAAQTYEVNGKTESKRLQIIQKLWVAEMMMERGNQFHYVYNLDWRGRMYPVGPALTPQGDDSAKALLRFHKGSHLGEDGSYWLAIHGANCYGVDKVSFDERIQWVEDNTDMILRCAADPLANREWAATKEAPFMFLAFCKEYARLQEWVDLGNAQEDFVSYIAVAFDGSCNGLQNFSAMLRDPIGGKATGLIPSEKPADIYSEVARVTQSIIDRDAASTDGERFGGRPATKTEPAFEGELKAAVAQRWVGKMSRKLAKRNTMTVPYGVTKRGMRDQLYAELQADDAHKVNAKDAGYLAECNYDAIGDVVVAARLAMDWLRDAAKVAASTALPVKWTTPTGFLAVQDYRDEIGEVLDFTVLGRRFQLLMNKTGEKLSTRKQALGISPNFVHSLDAAHLMRTVLFCAQDGITDFAMIHDSYGVHAGHATRLRDNLREAFIEQYKLPVLEQFRDELLEQLPPELHGELPPLPPMGTLDLEQVRHSEYFFA